MGESKHSRMLCENYEVIRQRHNKQINNTKDSSFFQKKKSCPGWD